MKHGERITVGGLHVAFGHDVLVRREDLVAAWVGESRESSRRGLFLELRTGGTIQVFEGTGIECRNRLWALAAELRFAGVRDGIPNP